MYEEKKCGRHTHLLFPYFRTVFNTHTIAEYLMGRCIRHQWMMHKSFVFLPRVVGIFVWSALQGTPFSIILQSIEHAYLKTHDAAVDGIGSAERSYIAALFFCGSV